MLLNKLHFLKFKDFVGICLFVNFLLLAAVGLFERRDALMQLELIDLLLKFELFGPLELLFLLVLELGQFDADLLFESLPPCVLSLFIRLDGFL